MRRTKPGSMNNSGSITLPIRTGLRSPERSTTLKTRKRISNTAKPIRKRTTLTGGSTMLPIMNGSARPGGKPERRKSNK